MVTRSDILTFDGFATIGQCAELVGWFDANIERLRIETPNSIFSGRFIDRPAQPTAIALARKAVALTGVGTGRQMALDAYQIVVWPKGSEQPAHIDDRREETRYAAIVYLNDDFAGGQTFFENADFQGQPQTGRLIAFPGRDLRHGVRRITSGTRYTLALWFKVE